MKFSTIVPLLSGFVLVLGLSAFCQTSTAHPAPWLNHCEGNLFLRLNGSGTVILANRRSAAGGEELVAIPTDGGAEQVWFSAAKPSILNRFAFAGDGETVVFAPGYGSCVFAVKEPGGAPTTVADVSPYGDPRQLQVSHDGRWVAFSASCCRRDGKLIPVESHVFVAATDGSALSRVTSAAIQDKYLSFCLSSDGSKIVWVDDRSKGPLAAGRDGSSPVRLDAGVGAIQSVAFGATSDIVLCQLVGDTGIKLVAAVASPAQPVEQYREGHGEFLVSRNGDKVWLWRLRACGGCEYACCHRDSAQWVEACCTVGPGYGGSRALSGNGNVLVWRCKSVSSGDSVRVMRVESP